MTRRSLSFAFVAVLLAGAVAAAQAHAPVVTMSVTTPDGRTQELTATESGLATLTLKDGTEYGFRPTIQDSSPWNRIVVTIFRSATANAPTTALGEIELRRGGPAVDSKTNPSFKVSVPKVSTSTTQTDSQLGTVWNCEESATKVIVGERVEVHTSAVRHDGSLASLEEMFDRARLSPDYVSNGWNPPGTTTRAIEGHPFGLALDPGDTAALLAFLRNP